MQSELSKLSPVHSFCPTIRNRPLERSSHDSASGPTNGTSSSQANAMQQESRQCCSCFSFCGLHSDRVMLAGQIPVISSLQRLKPPCLLQ